MSPAAGVRTGAAFQRTRRGWISWFASPTFILWLLSCQFAPAQTPPHIGYIYPAGGQAGQTFRVLIGGQFLGAISNAFVSGYGVTARVVELNRPMNQKEFNDFRDRIRVLQEKRRTARDANSTNTWTDADAAELDTIAARIKKNPPNRQGNPAIAETVTLEIEIVANADPGDRELRLASPRGLSNPIRFCVGTLREFSAPAAKHFGDEVERMLRQLGHPVLAQKSEFEIATPAVVNGQIMPGEVERLRFSARKGQRLVAALQARSLVPYIADAVPGWFQATLALFDSKGNEVAYNDDYHFSPDPVLLFDVPRDGEYLLQIKDSIYRGREDFVYRLSIGELPFVTRVFPLGGRAGETNRVVLEGWNLTESGASQLITNLVFPEPGLKQLGISSPDRIAHRLPFAVDSLPEVLEDETRAAGAKRQPLSLPAILNGRIDRPGDGDVFQFSAAAGDEIVAEVLARRLNSPLDSVLRLTDAAGKVIANNDDHEDKGAGLETHHADSYLRAKVPAAGTYFVQIADAQQRGGSELSYRLRLSSPRPGFELRVVPSSLNAAGNANVPVTVYALRKDGFTNEIALELLSGPEGASLSGGRIPANADQVRCTIALPVQAAAMPAPVRIAGRALIDGQFVSVSAVAADDCMQAFAYRHLVPAEQLLIGPHQRLGNPGSFSGTKLLRIPHDGSAQVPLSPGLSRLVESNELTLEDPPDGIHLDGIVRNSSGVALSVRCDAAKANPPLSGNLIISYAARPAAGQGKAPGPQAQRRAAGVLPAIPFEVVPGSQQEAASK